MNMQVALLFVCCLLAQQPGCLSLSKHLKICPLKFNLKFQIFMEVVQCLRARVSVCFSVSVIKYHLQTQYKEEFVLALSPEPYQSIIPCEAGTVTSLPASMKQREERRRRVQACELSKPSPSNVLSSTRLLLSSRAST